MKPEYQRVAIAEACGWKVHPKDKWVVIPPNSPHSVQPLNTLPNYLNDLNAMHDAEKVLTPTEFEAYRWILWGLCKRPQVTEWERAYLSATASQRAEAFLRKIGKWEEAK
jgi:hypothetical protein